MPNPHGTCAACDWHTVTEGKDDDGNVGYIWECWIDPGTATDRLVAYSAEREPPACERCYNHKAYVNRFCEGA